MDKNSLLIEKKRLRSEMRSRIESHVSRLDYSPRQILSPILDHLFSLPRFRNGLIFNIMIYLNLPAEFPTIPMIQDLFFCSGTGKDRLKSDHPLRSLAVPWCSGEDLFLFRLDSDAIVDEGDTILLKEMREGAYRILEPAKDLRERMDRQMDPRDLDLILVPGLAFDSNGGRLGRGAGFYDRFFQKTRNDVLLIGLAFDEQIVDSVPREPHDRLMDLVLTPTRIIERIAQ